MAPRNKLTPWIESLILSYGDREEASSGGRLKAHVVGASQMSQSQARGSAGQTGLLFLSDGQLQIPAVLTASGWERLQEKEERETLGSLLTATVALHDYRLQFHMDPEQTRCWFFLSVGALATTAAGPFKDSPPCCSSLASVRTKICRTWRSLLGQEDSQRSQAGLDLSELLGEWQLDCLQSLLRDVQERLLDPRGRASPRDTDWDLDRVRYRGEPSFSVPVQCLLIPEEDGGRSQMGGGSSDIQDAEWRRPDPGDADTPVMDGGMVQEAERLIPGDRGGEMETDAGAAGDSSPPLLGDLAPLSDPTLTLLSNPWDMFPPPDVSSSTSSPDSTPPLPPCSRSDSVATATGTQPPVASFLPPYQNQPTSSLPLTSSSSSAAVSPPEPTGTTVAPQDPQPEAVPGGYRKPKRKRCEVQPEEELCGSPPSWLFESQVEASGTERVDAASRAVPRKTPSVHEDGRPFSYSYGVSGQNLQDLSRFRLAVSLLHWAVRYLLTPQPTGDAQTVD